MSIGVDVHDRQAKGRLNLSCLGLPHGIAYLALFDGSLDSEARHGAEADRSARA
jgi:hypothetical protein